ncbi:hypothetical protein CsSME_00036694 [Camellia sinensis var. sinensis]
MSQLSLLLLCFFIYIQNLNFTHFLSSDGLSLLFLKFIVNCGGVGAFSDWKEGARNPSLSPATESNFWSPLSRKRSLEMIEDVGDGVPEKAFSSRSLVWLTGGHQLQFYNCERTKEAQIHGIVTLVCIPTSSGVLEMVCRQALTISIIASHSSKTKWKI